jgi:hypothetical protein
MRHSFHLLYYHPRLQGQCGKTTLLVTQIVGDRLPKWDILPHILIDNHHTQSTYPGAVQARDRAHNGIGCSIHLLIKGAGGIHHARSTQSFLFLKSQDSP